MFYRKNLGLLHSRVRLALGGTIALGAPLVLGLGTPALLIGASGIGLAASGWLGYCPACAWLRRSPHP